MCRAYGIDVLGGALYNLGEEAQNLVDKQRKDIEKTVKTDVEGSAAFSRIVCDKINRPGPSF